MNSLSLNYFKTWDSKFPVIQILQSRTIESDIVLMRLRCSDGINTYDHIGISKQLETKILKDRLYKADKYPIIKILKFYKNGCALIIENYEIISFNDNVHGTPKMILCDCHGIRENENLIGNKPIFLDLEIFEEAAIPIDFLTPYLSLKFVIKVKLVIVERIREIWTKNNTCHLLSMIGTDAKELKIGIKAFDETAIKVFKYVTEGQIYFFECQPSCIKPRYNPKDVHLHEYEIVLNNDSVFMAAQ